MHYDRIVHRCSSMMLGAVVLLMLAACGGGASGSAGTPNPTTVAVPTMPPARFTAVAQQSAFTQTATLTSSVTLTETASVTQTSATGVDDADLARGARSYERNQCGSCHGERGEGVAGTGAAIAGTALSEQEFENLLRTGGGLGNTHIFGPSAVSPAGMGALYAYVQSLQ